MIFNLSGSGGGAGLKIATGLSAPANPSENTIWVSSDKAGGKYVFAETEPESPAEGIIWFTATHTGIITKASVYTDGAWVTADVYMYLSGEWVQIASAWDGVLYADGAFSVDHAEKAVNGSVEYSDDHYTTKTKSGNLICEAYVVFGPVSLDDFSTLKMKAQKADSMGNSYLALLVAQTADATRDSAALKSEMNVTNSNEYTVSLDVSECTGDNWYIYAGTNTAGTKLANARIVDVMEVALS